MWSTAALQRLYRSIAFGNGMHGSEKGIGIGIGNYHSLVVVAWPAVPALEATTTAANVLMPRCGGCVGGSARLWRPPLAWPQTPCASPRTPRTICAHTSVPRVPAINNVLPSQEAKHTGSTSAAAAGGGALNNLKATNFMLARKTLDRRKTTAPTARPPYIITRTRHKAAVKHQKLDKTGWVEGAPIDCHPS